MHSILIKPVVLDEMFKAAHPYVIMNPPAALVDKKGAQVGVVGPTPLMYCSTLECAARTMGNSARRDVLPGAYVRHHVTGAEYDRSEVVDTLRYLPYKYERPRGFEA